MTVNVNPYSLVNNSIFINVGGVAPQIRDKYLTCLVQRNISDQGVTLKAIPTVDGNCTFEISEIIKLWIPEYVASGDSDYKIIDIFKFIATVSDEDNNSIAVNGTVLNGGIPNNIYRELAKNNSNIFAKKLTDYSKNFLLTTRTHKRLITLPVTELDWILFYRKQSMQGIRIKDAYTNEEYYSLNYQDINQANECITAVNLPKILTGLGITTGRVDIFSIVSGAEDIALCIEITQSIPTYERYILRFKNSYGAFERVEITGRAVSNSEYISENIEYEIFDSITGSLVTNSMRKPRRNTIEVEVGYRSQERLYFLRDLIQSDDVLLKVGVDRWEKVLVNAEDEIPVWMPEPSSIALTLKFLDTETNYSPDIFAEDDSELILGKVLVTEDNKFIITEDDKFIQIED